MAGSYQYTALETKSHIRVLSFMHPLRLENRENWGVEYNKMDLFRLEDVEFEIFQVDLDQKPVYQALSYVWGNPAQSSSIRLRDGTTISITENLREALTRLVASVMVMPVWIDQLCINQADLEERNHQVSMMGDIYMGAEHTIVWLGQEVEDCTQFLAYIIYSIRRLPEEEKTNEKREAWLKSHVDLQFDPENPTLEGKCFRALQEVLNRPWFRRAWVFQEAVLSRNVVMFVGKLKWHLQELITVVEGVYDLQYAIEGYRNSLAKTTSGWESLDSIDQLRRGHFKHSKVFLRFLWRVGGYWEATEKRDMFFAFLGLLNKSDLFEPLGYEIRPDYSSPLRDLYISITRTIVEGSGSLDVLGKVIGCEQKLYPEHMQIGDHLPRWVPDWAVSTPTIWPFHNGGDNSFDACKGYRHKPASSGNPDTLLVRGKIVIREILHAIIWDFEKHYFMDADRSFLNLDWHYEELLKLSPKQHRSRRSISRKLRKLFSGRGPEKSATPTRERLLKTLIADGANPRHDQVSAERPSMLSDQRVRELLHAYDMWPRLSEDQDIPDREKVEKALKDLQQQSLIVQAKRLVVCEGGYLAMVPRMAGHFLDAFREEGLIFEIAILHGSKTPIVLVRDYDGGKYPRYTVFGQCYVEDHMYGEAVNWKEEDGDIFELT